MSPTPHGRQSVGLPASADLFCRHLLSLLQAVELVLRSILRVQNSSPWLRVLPTPPDACPPVVLFAAPSQLELMQYLAPGLQMHPVEE
jgi:hypothetical protein